jgi:hypothetical protein
MAAPNILLTAADLCGVIGAASGDGFCAADADRRAEHQTAVEYLQNAAAFDEIGIGSFNSGDTRGPAGNNDLAHETFFTRLLAAIGAVLDAGR